jgi:hypothetical protein
MSEALSGGEPDLSICEADDCDSAQLELERAVDRLIEEREKQ